MNKVRRIDELALKSNTQIASIHKKWGPSLFWLLLVLCTICVMLYRNILLDFSTYPINIREGAGPALTWFILHNGLTALYSNAAMPIYNNVYGAGFSILSLPWVHFFHNIAIAHRLSETFLSVLATLVFYQASYMLSQSRLLSFALALTFISGCIWSAITTVTWGDTAGLLFSQLIILLAICPCNLNYKLIGVIGLTFIAFIIKPYFAFYGIAIFIWLPALIGIKKSLKWYGLLLIQAIIFIILCEWLFPWYLWNTIIQYSAYLGGTKAHLYEELKLFWENNNFWVWFLLASGIVYLLLIKNSFFQEKKIIQEDYSNPKYGSLAFWIYMTMLFGLAMYYMGQNTGRERTYFVELFNPQLYFLICSVVNKILTSESNYSWLQKKIRIRLLTKKNILTLSKKNLLVLFLLAISLLPGIFEKIIDYSFPLREFIFTTESYSDIFNLKKNIAYARNSNIWDSKDEKVFSYIQKFLNGKKNIFHTPWLTNILLDKNLPIYDSSHTQHFRGPIQDTANRDYFGLHLSRIMPSSKQALAKKLWLSYWDNIKNNIHNRKFDLIVLEDKNYSKTGYLLMFDYASYYMANQLDFNKAMDDFYYLIEKNYIAIGHVNRFHLTIYEPRDYLHAKS